MSTKVLFLIAFSALFLSGCSTLWDWSGGTRNGTSSSLVDYLYPDGAIPPDVQDSIPYLKLPLRVGLAFELDRFRERVQEDPTVAEVKRREGSGGGGSVNWLLLCVLALFGTRGAIRGRSAT